MNNIDVMDLKRQAAGRWPEILSRLGGISETLLDGKHHECPRCGGTDRFRMIDEADGACLCNQCLGGKCGDGLAVLQWATGVTFPDAKQLVADYLNVTPAPANGHKKVDREGERPDPMQGVLWVDDEALLESSIEQWSQAKQGIKPDAVRRYGARLCRWPKNGPHSETCLAFLGRCSLSGAVRSVLLYRVDGREFPASGSLGARKSHLVRGSTESWLWPGDRQALLDAKVVPKLEGLPDTLALASVMPDDWLPTTNVCGAKSTRKLDYTWAPGKYTPVFADADKPGLEGAELHKAALQKAGAIDARVVVPPYEISPDHGKDIRDWLNEGHDADDVVAMVKAAKGQIVPSAESSRQIGDLIEHDPNAAPFDESEWQIDTPIVTGSKTWEQRYKEGTDRHGTGLNASQHDPQVLKRLAEKTKPPDPPPKLLRYKPFPVDVFSRPVQRFIKAVAKSVLVDPVLVAQPVLAVLSTATGGSVRFSPKDGWYEPASLWTLALSDSGSGKSPAAKQPLKILQRIQSDAFRKHDAAMGEHNQKLMAYEVAKKAWQSGGSKRGEQAPEKPEEPPCQRLITSDVTVEKLAVLLNENPRGLLLWRDEWSGWLKSFDQYKGGKGGDLGHYLSIWSGESIYVDRKVLGKRPIHVPEPFCALFGGCQPPIWGRLLRNGELIECGLIARFLVAMPPRQSQRWAEEGIDEAVAEAMKTVVLNLLSIPLKHDDDGEPKPRILKLNAGAKAYFAKWHDKLADEQEALSGNLAAFFSKLKGMAVRIAGVLQLTRWASGEDASANEIDLKSLEDGCRLADWFANEALRIDGTLRETPDQLRQRLLIEKLEQLGGRTTVRNLCRRMKRFMGKAEQAEAELLELQELGLGTFEVSEPGPEGGQPLREFVLKSENPIDTTPENVGPDEVVSMSTINEEDESEAPQGTVISEEGGATWIDMTI